MINNKMCKKCLNKNLDNNVSRCIICKSKKLYNGEGDDTTVKELADLANILSTDMNNMKNSKNNSKGIKMYNNVIVVND